MAVKRIGLYLSMIGAAAIFADALLVQPQGGGWLLIASAAAIAGSAAWVSMGHPGAFPLPAGLCVLTSVPIVAGAAWSSDPQMGVGRPLPLAAAGAVVALVGSLLLGRGASSAAEHVRTSTDTGVDPVTPSRSVECPRCTRPVDAGARTCRRCGFAVRRYRKAL